MNKEKAFLFVLLLSYRILLSFIDTLIHLSLVCVNVYSLSIYSFLVRVIFITLYCTLPSLSLLNYSNNLQFEEPSSRLDTCRTNSIMFSSMIKRKQASLMIV